MGYNGLGRESLPSMPNYCNPQETLEEWTKKQKVSFPDSDAISREREKERAAERERAVQQGKEWDRERERIAAEERVRAESISKHKQIVPTGVKIWGGKELDAGTSEMSVDDAWATYVWYDLYGRTPTERGGTTTGSEKVNVDRWAAAAKQRYNELTLAGVKRSTLWAAIKGAAESVWNNPLVVYNPLIAPLTAGVRFWIGVPQTIEDMQERAAQRTKLLLQGGYGEHAAGILAFIMSIGDLLPSNKFVESISGTSLTTGRDLTLWERAKAGAEATLETVLLAIGATRTPKFVPKPVFIVELVGPVAKPPTSLILSPTAKPVVKQIFTAEAEAEAAAAFKRASSNPGDAIWMPVREPIGLEVQLGPMRPPNPSAFAPPLSPPRKTTYRKATRTEIDAWFNDPFHKSARITPPGWKKVPTEGGKWFEAEWWVPVERLPDVSSTVLLPKPFAPAPFKPKPGPGAPFIEEPLPQIFRPALKPGDQVSSFNIEEAHAWIRANPSWRLRWIPETRMYEIVETAPPTEVNWWD
jgi:hypothetical protein